MKNLTNQQNKCIFKNFTILLLIFAVTITALGFITDLLNTLRAPGIDFRNRIVGARLLRKGLDPYYFKWTPNYPETLLDPLDKPVSPVTRTTIPPTTLVLISPIANLPYKTLRLLWFAFQWTALLLSLYLIARSSKSQEKSRWIWILGLIFVAGSHGWHSHIKLGQIYILYVLILALAFQQLMSSHRLGTETSGFLIGFAASMKFPVVLMGFPLLIYKRWKLIVWSVIGFIFGVGGSFLIAGVKIWESYFTAMRKFGKIRFIWEQWPYANYPQIIEGVNWQGKAYSPVIAKGEASLFRIAHQFFGINIAAFIPIVFATVVLLSGIILFMHRKKKLSTGLIFQAGIVFIFMGEFLLPGPRWVYQDVIWLILLSLVIINAKSLKELMNPLLILVLLGISLSIGITWLPFRNKIMEAAMLIYFIFITLSFIRKSS